MKETLALAMLVALSSPSLGCAVSSGLANVPALGTTPGAERRVHDVIANGNDSCERRATGSPLRGRLPPCANQGASTPITAFQPMSRFERNSDDWLNPVYLRWPYCATTLGGEDLFASRTLYSGSWTACADENPW